MERSAVKTPQIRHFRRLLRSFERLTNTQLRNCCAGVTLAQCLVLRAVPVLLLSAPLAPPLAALLQACPTPVVLAGSGPDALTVRRIATEASMSTMNVYSRFGGKDGVIDELYSDGFRRLVTAIDAVPTTDDVPGEFAERLIGQPVSVVDEDGAPSGAKTFVFWNPPHKDETQLERRSSHLEAERWLAPLR